MEFSGRTIVVTGAARGMGRAIAKAFAEKGGRVALWGRTPATLEAAASAIGRDAFAVPCDLGDPSAIEAAFAATLRIAGRVHVLINNAGISGEAVPFLSMTAAAWDEMLAVNLRGPMLAGVLAARHMAEMGGGVILHNASIAGSGVDGPYAHYSASKAGLLALMRSMAVELAPHGVRCNAVSPGYTQTDMTMQYFPPEQAEFLKSGFVRAPIRRIVTAEEVANAFVFLASDAASGVTGANLVVDGGLTADLYIMPTFPPTKDASS
jgi:NAD(P)-dependent dehydrogenase (short-subunit alcohol dehydrogenase family)